MNLKTSSLKMNSDRLAEIVKILQTNLKPQVNIEDELKFGFCDVARQVL